MRTVIRKVFDIFVDQGQAEEIAGVFSAENRAVFRQDAAGQILCRFTGIFDFYLFQLGIEMAQMFFAPNCCMSLQMSTPRSSAFWNL